MDPVEPLPVTRLARLAPAPEAGARWLIEDLWAAEAVGCVGGLPKQGKTWLGLEMAVAVASGKPCLGRFRVASPGPVLGVRNETLGVAIDRLLAAGRLLRVDGGLAVHVPASADRRERNGP